jgi:Tfp pilus assembly protein PilN
MAARKKDEQINLLPQKGYESSTSGRILAWILTTFRVIVIVTEIIVMIAFLSRFWFDAQNSDLNEKLQQKQAVLAASQEFEMNFKDVQNRLKIYSALTKNQSSYSEILSTITEYLPSDMILTKFSVKDENIEIVTTSSNERSVEQFVVNLATMTQIEDVGLIGISTEPDNPTILFFTIGAKLNPNTGGE